jgi:hypothetical protein
VWVPDDFFGSDSWAPFLKTTTTMAKKKKKNKKKDPGLGPVDVGFERGDRGGMLLRYYSLLKNELCHEERPGRGLSAMSRGWRVRVQRLFCYDGGEVGVGGQWWSR